MNKKIFKISCVMLLCLALAACSSTPAATSSQAPSAASTPETPKINYPTQAIKVMIGYAAGGSDDIVARTTVDCVNKFMPNGQVMYCENLVGASGTLAATEVFRSKPDGYTLMLCGSGVLCGQPLTLETEYDGTMITPIATVCEIANAMVVPIDAPYDTFQEWVDWCKAHPGEFTYGTSGKNGPGHIASTAVAMKMDIDVTPVFFGGTGEAVPQMLGGHLMGVTSKDCEFAGLVESGQVKVLYLTNPNGIWGDTLQLKDMGCDVSYTYSSILFGPPDMPKEIVDIIYEAVEKAFQDDLIKNSFANIYTIPKLSNPEETAQIIRDGLDFNRELLISMGITPTR